MSRQLRVGKDAEIELAAAALYYESKRAGLGVELVAAVDAVLARIRDEPATFQAWHPSTSTRRAVVPRFPFVVFFTVVGDTVGVWAIAHAKRRPGYWVGRPKPY